MAGDPARHVYDPLFTLYMKILNFVSQILKQKESWNFEIPAFIL